MNITVKEYTLLFNAVTNALEQLEALKFALILAQQQASALPSAWRRSGLRRRDCGRKRKNASLRCG